MGGWIRAMTRAIECSIVLAAFLASPLSVSAHVNGAVGPYKVFIVLIEEPFFVTNRAGFEFWVREGDRPVDGLDRTLRAQAINSTQRVDLAVSPRNDRGFYDVETGLSGQAFDPGSGGIWTLRLIGTIEGLAVDKSFEVTFPDYPRVSPIQPPAKVSVAAPDIGAPLFAIGGFIGAAVGFLVLGASSRRRMA
jgi:hypothetical protein